MENTAPRGVRIGAINWVSVLFAGLLLLLFLSAVTRATAANRALNAATEKYVASEMAAVTLKQGSDNLTTQVRLYTVTGDAAFLRAYFAEVASQSREQAVETLRENLADTDAYYNLEHALGSSLELMNLEYYAMALVLDATGGAIEPGMEAVADIRLRPEDAALDREGKLSRAVSLTHGAQYQSYDESIDEDVAQCIANMHAQREAAIRENTAELARVHTQQALSAGLLAAVIFVRTVITTLYILRPMEAYVDLIAADQPLPSIGAYEVQYLSRAYNSMYAQRKERDILAAERLQTLDLLERERANLNIIHEMLHSGMWSMDFDEYGKMTDVYWSAQFRRMLGYESEADFPNKLESWSDLLAEEDRDRVLKEYNDTIADYSGQKTYDVEYRLLTRDRGWRWFHAVGRLSRREDGTPITYVGLFMDITEQKELARQLEEHQVRLQSALEQAQAASRAKTAFLTNMSHDLRTPMNAIIGFTTLAESHVDSRETVLDDLKKISVASGHLLSLIDNVLEMSRMESEQMGLQEQACSLQEILYDVKTMVQAEISSKQLSFQLDAADVVDEMVICDRTKLNQVLLNVLGNAVKFTPDGGAVGVRVRQTAYPEDGTAAYEFRVQDTGIGMSREFQAHLFEAFARERTSTVSGLQGTGLGMAITKNIVDLMGGEITVNSEEGKGTEVTITLPLRVFRAAERPEAETAREEVSFEGRRVLLVEDNEINQEIATMILEEAGLTVDTADDGSIAVEKVRASVPGYYDVIFMDLQMPVMNGYEAARQIRALDGPQSRIPIIALSANALEEDRKRSIEAGMDSHMGKPFDVQELLDVLRRYLK